MLRPDLVPPRRARRPPVTRFAPSPTGYLHLGHVVNAIYVWGLARAPGGRVILRIEDHDRLRCRPQYEAALLEDLDWLGFVPDEGRHPPARQSDRPSDYRGRTRRAWTATARRLRLRLLAETRLGASGTTAAAATAASRADRGAACACASTGSRSGQTCWPVRSSRRRRQCGDLLFATATALDLPVRGHRGRRPPGRHPGHPGARPGRLHRTAGGAGAAAGPPGRRRTSCTTRSSWARRGEKLSKSADDTGVRELRARAWPRRPSSGWRPPRSG